MKGDNQWVISEGDWPGQLLSFMLGLGWGTLQRGHSGEGGKGGHSERAGNTLVG